MDWKNVLLGAYAGLSLIKDLWELFSDKPLITGVSDIATLISKYWLIPISLFIFLLIVLPPIIDRTKNLQNIYQKHFTKEELVLDGKRYVDCNFLDCTIIYNGGKFVFDNTKINGSLNIRTDNPVISRTLLLLKVTGTLEQKFADSIRRSAIKKKQ